MGKTFVYNSGESANLPGTLEKTYGMFFDGTGNNLRNTEIRKKVRHIEEYKYESATEDEMETYRKEAKTTKHHWYGYKRSANSFMNDFSNVARMKLCSSKDYTVYTEGIGTENEEDDDIQGSAFGMGDRGIRTKVRKGCETLAEKINPLIRDSEEQIKVISLTLDVSGFSRGAAAARNFVYEVKKGTYKPRQKPVPGGQGITFPADSFDEYIDEGYLIDGELPPHGHLGYALVKGGIDKELVKKLSINIRFVGIYDTVAAYGLNKKKGVQRLNLDNLGVATKVVHFTATDEHRENFALTRIKTGIEKNFPGVHSDIGGGYDNGAEEINEIEIDPSDRLYRKINGDPLEKFKNHLIQQGSFLDLELEIHNRLFRPYRQLTATRKYVGKEYSYLILNYMEYFAIDYLVNNEIITSTKEKYPINSHQSLLNAKIRLDDYVNKDGEEWKLISSREVEREETTVFSEEEKQVRFPIDISNDNPLETEEKSTYGTVELEGITIYPYDKWLKDLRHGYFHWSADYDWVGMNPTKDRIRKEI